MSWKRLILKHNILIFALTNKTDRLKWYLFECVIDNNNTRIMAFVSPDIGVVSVMNIVIVNATRSELQSSFLYAEMNNLVCYTRHMAKQGMEHNMEQKI